MTPEVRICQKCFRPILYGETCHACEIEKVEAIPPPDLEHDNPSEEAGAERKNDHQVTRVFGKTWWF